MTIFAASAGQSHNRSPVWQYLFAATALAGATLARWLLDPALGDHLPYVTYFVAVALVAWRASLLPSLATLFAGWWISDFLFSAPRYVWVPGMATPQEIAGTLTYFMVGAATIAVSEAMRHARRRSERSDASNSAILQTALDCIVTIDHEGMITDFNPACEKTFGYSRAQAIGREMGELIVPPSLRAQHRAGLARYVSTGEAKVLNRRIELTAMRADGTEFPVELAITRISGSGTPLFTGYLRDITERKNAEKRQQILTNELNHRVKNMLSVIQSIAHHTAHATPDPKQFFDAFSERLVGMARVHDMLTANTWKGADLRSIAEATFSPYRRTDTDHVRFSGPAIILSPDASVSIGLALHELATNAAKYGALSQPTGRVDVTWKEVQADSRRIVLDWRESGGPAVQQPLRQGFGTRLIEMVASQLAAEISIDYAKAGLVCRMEFPLKDAAREADPAASQ